MATRVRLRMACPVCIDNGIASPAYYWNHAGDGDSDLYLNEYGTIDCVGCGREWQITNSLWGCPNHSSSVSRHSYEYKAASVTATIFAISQAALLLKGQASAQWFQ